MSCSLHALWECCFIFFFESLGLSCFNGQKQLLIDALKLYMVPNVRRYLQISMATAADFTYYQVENMLKKEEKQNLKKTHTAVINVMFVSVFFKMSVIYESSL